MPGCPRLVTTKNAQCRAHQKAADQRGGSTYARGYGKAWEKLRAEYLRVHPFCAWHGPPVWAQEVDHIDGDTSHNDWRNLRALCRPCHRSRTGRDQPGGTRLP